MIPSLVLALALFSAPEAEARSVARDFLLRAHEGIFDELDRAKAAEHLERKIRDALRIRCIRVEGVVFERVEIGGETAVVEVEIATRKSDRATPEEWMPIETMPLRLRLQREGGRWRVASVEYPDEELAELLVAPNLSPDEQHCLLRLHERRLTKNLARIVDRISLSHANSKNFAAAAPIGKLANRLAMFAGDRAGEALSISLASVVARLAKDRGRALRLSREAVAVAEEAGDPEVLSRTWRTLARVLEEDGTQPAEYEEALLRGLAFALRSEDPLLIARAFHSMAGFALDKRDFFSGRSYTEQSLPFVRASGDLGAEITYELNLQTIYCSQGDRDLCEHHLQRLLGLMANRESWHRPYALFDFATLQIADGRLEEARATLNNALQEASVRTLDIVPAVLEQIAVIEAREGRIEEAECILRETDALNREIGFQHGPLFDLIMPEILAHGDHAKAVRLSLEEAARTQELLLDSTMRALMNAARGYRALGMRERALATAREAIELSERSMELNAGSELQQVRSAESVASCYELAADLELAGGDVKEALTLVERGRGQVLYDMIERGRPASYMEVEAADRTMRARHEQRLSQLNVELARAEAADKPRETNRLRGELLDARHQYESFLDGLRVRGERRMAALRPLHASSLDEVLRQLPGDLAVIEYVVREDQIHAFVVRTDTSPPLLSIRTLPIDRKTLEARVEKLVAMIVNRDLRYATAARELYALLVRPLEQDLAGANVLCIVPNEALWRVPFAALMDEQGRFLVERAAIFHAPSMTVYAAMARRETPIASGHQMLALANPTLDRDISKQLTSYFRGATFGALLDAEREVDAIRDLYGSSNCVVLKREEATETRAKEEMQGARILHFATHGLLDDRNPLYSRLLLGRDVQAGDDGSLEAWEIARLRIDADLVVLSACDTARGMIGGGEGVVGIAWSFFAAGARSTIATGWKIGSRSASDVMVGFYEALRSREGEPLAKARALRDAQLQLIHGTNTRHPFHWAAFVLLGDGS